MHLGRKQVRIYLFACLSPLVFHVAMFLVLHLRLRTYVIQTCISGVPKLKRSELEAGCEDFSNVIGSSPIGTLYKGTLSTGVEIAVVSVAVTPAKDWSKSLEVQFRKKVICKQILSNYLCLWWNLTFPDSFLHLCFRLTHYQKWTTRILSIFLGIVRRRSLSQEWWFLNMLRMGHFLSIYIVSWKHLCLASLWMDHVNKLTLMDYFPVSCLEALIQNLRVYHSKLNMWSLWRKLITFFFKIKDVCYSCHIKHSTKSHWTSLLCLHGSYSSILSCFELKFLWILPNKIPIKNIIPVASDPVWWVPIIYWFLFFFSILVNKNLPRIVNWILLCLWCDKLHLRR